MTEESSSRRPQSERPTRRYGALRGILLVALLLFGVWPMFVRIQRSLIYAPLKAPVTREMAQLPLERIRDVQLTTSDGVTLHGWLTTPESLSAADRELVIIFPGNAGHRAYRAELLDDFNRLGCDALIFDYRGYGENEGAPSEEAFARDAREVFRWAVNELGWTPSRIILCGESLGGGVATRLAAELQSEDIVIGGLILRTTFASLVETGKTLYPWLPVGTVLVDRYPSADRIRDLQCPILVLHGAKDRITPLAQGRKLFEAAPEQSETGVAKEFVLLPNAGHNDVRIVAGAEIDAAHRRFFESLRRARVANVAPPAGSQPLDSTR